METIEREAIERENRVTKEWSERYREVEERGCEETRRL